MNHSIIFVDSTTHTLTQKIEPYWAREKHRMKGCHAHQVSGYLNEFMWRDRHDHSKVEAFTNVMRDIADFLPV